MWVIIKDYKYESANDSIYKNVLHLMNQRLNIEDTFRTEKTLRHFQIRNTRKNNFLRSLFDVITLVSLPTFDIKH